MMLYKLLFIYSGETIEKKITLNYRIFVFLVFNMHHAFVSPFTEKTVYNIFHK